MENGWKMENRVDPLHWRWFVRPRAEEMLAAGPQHPVASGRQWRLTSHTLLTRGHADVTYVLHKSSHSESREALHACQRRRTC